MNKLSVISLALLISVPAMAQRLIEQPKPLVCPHQYRLENVVRTLDIMPPFAPVPKEKEIGELPACVRIDSSDLRFPSSPSSLFHFHLRVGKVLLHAKGNVNIWHIGGSHVQGGYLSNRLMADFSSMAPWMSGEKGFVFPYKMAATNHEGDYRMTFEGRWIAGRSSHPSKMMPEGTRYGITGMAGVTRDSLSSVSLCFPDESDKDRGFKQLRVFGYGTSEKTYPYIVCQCDTLRSAIDSLTMSYYFSLPSMTDSVNVHFNVPSGESFTFCGMQPISGRCGINYYASGVNGASLSTWLTRCPDMPGELNLVKPDLVIFGLGINDSACPPSKFDPEKFKDNYRELIGIIRSVSPDCSFIFITNNDSYRYVRRGMTHNDNAVTVQRAMYELAREYDAAVWDLFSVMGGNNTVLKWRSEGLVRPDKLHFTKEGYRLLGDMLYNAVVRDYQKYIQM